MAPSPPPAEKVVQGEQKAQEDSVKPMEKETQQLNPVIEAQNGWYCLLCQKWAPPMHLKSGRHAAKMQDFEKKDEAKRRQLLAEWRKDQAAWVEETTETYDKKEWFQENE